MKEFFEEYGRTIVTVLIILGIILVGYTIAGNGQNSAFGKFTTATVDSLTGQASSLIKDSAEYIEKKASMSSVKPSNLGTATVTSEKDGVETVELTGNYSWGRNTKMFASDTDSDMLTAWGQKSVMSFDIMADRDASISIDFNAYIDGVTGNDNYKNNARVSVDGNETVHSDSRGDISFSGNKWHHAIVILENGNETMNPKHLDMKAGNLIYYMQDSGTTKYQLKNVKYGNAD